ncbi:hypothetical protein CSC2_18700 [Clostridium zeae]|uniref:Uncharacterized protein n=1 Tax=Clostridium zeae TaxID=2759022 RepID=A0ABQ1E9A3_9CLOT|nr:hypothetical protein [Clostridium zeae]GFZ31344.1 hypothetical protein CSC2_18700 [Clostridium zeae]
MADQSISRANLNYIENNLSKLANNLAVVAENIEVVSSQVGNVDNRVNSVATELTNLTAEFRNFVNESKRVANLADAKQTVVLLEQELRKNFGNYETIRNHTVGILQASDLSIVKKETIENATEEMMISTPRYWLAPALIALSAWLSDNKELADKALKEAMRRDDEKTSLLFCLISRRAGKLDGSLVWLERYFAMQDPKKMERRIIVVLDAFAGGLFGGDINGICINKIKDWLNELSSSAGFVEKQREQWQSAILARKATIDENSFPVLSKYSPTWVKLKEVLEFAEIHEDIYEYFSNIFNTKVNNAPSLSAKIDEILDNLVKNYDNDELPLRTKLRKNQLTIEENGDIQRATQRFAEEVKAYSEYEDFSQHLTSIALTPESSGALITTQKLAITLSKEWIVDAYEDLTAKNRASVPLEVELEISDWKNKSRDGSNEAELKTSLNDYMDNIKAEQLSKLKFPNKKVITAGIIGAILFVLSIVTIIGPIIVAAITGIYIFMQKKAIDKGRNSVIEQIENERANYLQILNGFLAEVVDFRRLYSEKDRNSQKVIDLLNELTPEQYITVQNSNKVRQVL